MLHHFLAGLTDMPGKPAWSHYRQATTNRKYPAKSDPQRSIPGAVRFCQFAIENGLQFVYAAAAMWNSTLHQTYHAHERELIRFLARRLRCMATARDMAQEIYLKLRDVQDEGAIRNSKAYLFRMAANLATDHQRGEARRAELLKEAQELLWGDTASATPEAEYLARDELRRVEQTIASLPPQSRQIFMLNRFEARSQREIAILLGVSHTTVEKHIRKALDHLAAARDGTRE